MPSQVLKQRKCEYCRKPYEENEQLDKPEYSASTFCSLKCATADWRDMSGVPIEFWQTELQKLACTQQIAHVAEWVKQRNDFEGKPGLLLHGEISGTGKTRIGTWAFNHCVVPQWYGREDEIRDVKSGDDYASGRWFNVNRFREHYRRILRDEEAKAEWQHELSNCYTLFLDDIDKLKPSEGLLELVFGVLDERFTSHRTTIATTNATGEELATRWGDEFGEYIVRRLRDYCLCIDFDP